MTTPAFSEGSERPDARDQAMEQAEAGSVDAMADAMKSGARREQAAGADQAAPSGQPEGALAPAIEEAEPGAKVSAETGGGAEEGVAPVANEALPSVESEMAAVSLLPMAPDVTLEKTPTGPLPTLPRYGPPITADWVERAPKRTPRLDSSKLDGRPAATRRWTPLATLAALITLPALLIALLWPVITSQLARLRQPDQLPALTTRLASAKAITRLDAANAAFGSETYDVAPAFAAYYAAHDGHDTLGQAITPVFTSNLGETQFFTGGALVSAGNETAEAIASAASDGPRDLDPDMARNGVDDSGNGVIALSLSQELLALGSAAPVGGDDSGATYVTLRSAARPDAFLIAPKPAGSDVVIRAKGAPEVIVSTKQAFVVEGKRGRQAVGHSVPLALWTYINRGDISPQGWATDIGAPLTEPLEMTATRDGARHHLQVQAFAQTVLIVDMDQRDASGAPTIATQPAGRDYLVTAGGPAVHVSAQSQRWVTANGALRTAAGASGVAVGLNANSAVTLSGAAQWVAGDLWYAVSWRTPSRNGAAWVDANTLINTKPTAIPVDSFDALSPDLAKYLAARGRNTGVVAYDVTRGVMYSYNSGGLFIMASSAKVPLMVSYLEYIESQGRGPNGSEVATLTAMIEHSDNNAAQLIYDTLGYADGQRSHMRGWGITDYVSNAYGWGWAKWSPGDMARLLSLLQAGKVLDASDRSLALYLMSHIESDQQFGVGDSAPSGAKFWMKNGWVTGPDGAWNVNSSGIVKVGGETYIVTVYNGELGSFEQGVDIVNHVCGTIGQALK